MLIFQPPKTSGFVLAINGWNDLNGWNVLNNRPDLNVELGTLNLKPSHVLIDLNGWNVLNDWNYLNFPKEGLLALPDKTKADAGASVARVAPAPER
jgi:hypothetical protein